jgi:hypothetical protein
LPFRKFFGRLPEAISAMSTVGQAGAESEAATRGRGAAEAERLLAVSLDLLLIADFDCRIRRVTPAWVRIGCTMVQGFRFAPAVPPEEISELLDRVG